MGSRGAPRLFGGQGLLPLPRATAREGP